MSSSRVAKVLTGMVLAAFLTIALPGSSEAAGRGSAAPSGDAWGLVMSWLSDLWNGALREPLAGTSGFSSVFAKSGAPAPAMSTTCKSDQGVCIDPNG